MFGLALSLLLASATPPVPVAGAEIAVGESDYPPDAMRAEATGTTTARFVVGSDGVPRACEIVESAGNASLDAATCRILLRARFDPARDRRKRAIEASVTKRVCWKIERRLETVARQTLVRFEIDPAGQVNRCVETKPRVDDDDLGWCLQNADLAASTSFLTRALGRPLAGVATVELDIASAEPGALPPATDKERIVFRNVVDSAALEIAPSGLVSGCTTLEFFPSETNSSRSYCSKVDGNLQLMDADPTAAPVRRLQVTMEWIARRSSP